MGSHSLYLFGRRLLPAIHVPDLFCSATILTHYCRTKDQRLSIYDSASHFLVAEYVYYFLVPTSPQFEDGENGFWMDAILPPGQGSKLKDAYRL